MNNIEEELENENIITTDCSEQIAAAVSGYGKFDSAEELLKAYNSLESEFTKRCQRIKSLEELNKQLEERCVDAYSIALELLGDDEFVETHIIVRENIASRIIADYLKSLSVRHNAPLIGGGTGFSPLAPVNKPKTLIEAKILAEKFLSRQ